MPLSADLLATKLYQPVAGHRLVPRSRLVRRLDEGHGPLVGQPDVGRFRRADGLL